jgi:hypothetical protein
MLNDSVIINYFFQYSWLIIILLIWSFVCKGIALWKSARLSDKAWFIILLIVNTLGILEIFYIFIFSKRDNKLETKIKNKNT